MGRFAVWIGCAGLFVGIGLVLLDGSGFGDVRDLGGLVLFPLLGGFLSLLLGLIAWRGAAMALGASNFVVLAVVVPGLLRACCGGTEASAIGSLRSINSWESTYSSSCGGDGYAQSLEDLAKSAPGSNQGFISPDLAVTGVIKSGYFVTLGPDADAVIVTPASKTCNGARADAVSSYFAEAHPVKVGETGQRSFATDSRGTIYFSNTGAVIQPGMAGASVLQ